MANKTFLFQEKLEELVATKKATVSGCTMTMTDNNLVYTILPAVKFIHCETSSEDPFKLVGKIAPYDRLNEEGAEIFLSSIIYKKHSYKVEQGYICSPEKN